MAKRRNLFLGMGCGALLVALVIGAFMLAAVKGPGIPDDMVLGITLAGPIAEVTAEDPFAELMGDQATSLRDLRTALVRAAEDERVKGVRLRVDSWGGGLATAQEIRSLLARVRAAGKWTAAYMDSAGEFRPGNTVYWVASACDEISVNPMGDVNLLGYSVRSPFIRGTLDKLGARPEFPGRGRYKTARFMYTHNGFTPAQEEMTRWIVDSIIEQFVGDIAVSRGMTSEQVLNLVNNGPYIGQEAIDANLIDHREDWTGFIERLDDRDDWAEQVVGIKRYLADAGGRSSGPKIAVVTATGTIMRGTNRKNVNPLFGGDVMGSETIAKAWRDVRKAKGIKAAVFRVDSPGGSAVASEVIRAEMTRTADQIPVVVSMANVAASGGYWISCGAQKIVAYPATQTGSIGVFAGHMNMDEFWSKHLGVSFGRIDFNDNAALYGELEDWTPEQREIIERMLDRIYDSFLKRVAEARESTPEKVHEIAEGRVFTGVQALENGLVDVLGGFDVAVMEAKRLAGIADDARVTIVDFPKVVPWWQQMLKSSRSDEVAVQQTMAELDRWWKTGVAQTPGTLWMPPLYIE